MNENQTYDRIFILANDHEDAHQFTSFVGLGLHSRRWNHIYTTDQLRDISKALIIVLDNYECSVEVSNILNALESNRNVTVINEDEYEQYKSRSNL